MVGIIAVKNSIAYLFAILGLALSVTNASAVVNVLWNGIASSRALMSSSEGDPSHLSAIAGETIIAVASHGLLAIVPTALLYMALTGFRLRQRWFYSCARMAAVYFLFVPPFATVYGIILLVALRRRKSEFASNAHAAPPSQSAPSPPDLNPKA
ncbi:MAG: hypothetical protein J0L73_16730 [Verrucomicrobia bacterium]|nr:hypothetical protein [Verrucomicrobiota bacterium]